jgi:hypothetical protein
MLGLVQLNTEELGYIDVEHAERRPGIHVRLEIQPPVPGPGLQVHDGRVPSMAILHVGEFNPLK